jgi:hypothetical protein
MQAVVLRILINSYPRGRETLLPPGRANRPLSVPAESAGVEDFV